MINQEFFVRHFGENIGKALYADLKNQSVQARIDIDDLYLKNPYKMTGDGLHGGKARKLSFEQKDQAAIEAGLPVDAPVRICEAGKNVLNHMIAFSSNTWEHEKNVFAKVQQLLEKTTPRCMTIETIQQTLYDCQEGHRQRFTFSNGAMFPTYLYEAEQKVAQKIAEIARCGDPICKTVPPERLTANHTNDLRLTEEQQEAVVHALTSPLSVIIGGAGVGKTTVIKEIVRLASEYVNDDEIALCAPTGKAARRMTDAVGKEASTIHRLLGYQDGTFRFNQHNPIPYRMVIVDEMSMLPVGWAQWLFSAISTETSVVLVGDVKQLPAVGSGDVLMDLIRMKKKTDAFPVVRLKQIHRQGEGSQIVVVGSEVLNGVMTPSFGGDCRFQLATTDDQAERMIIAEFKKRCIQEQVDIMDFQILTPMKKGVGGTERINERIQKLWIISLGNATEADFEPSKRKRRFFAGDKVIQTSNDYQLDVMNGQIGLVYEDEYGDLRVRFETGVDIDLREFDERQSLELAYAITVHKFQGSQCLYVAIFLGFSQKFMLNRNIYYTALTRAQLEAVTFGNVGALQLAVLKKAIPRQTSLSYWFHEAWQQKDLLLT